MTHVPPWRRSESSDLLPSGADDVLDGIARDDSEEKMTKSRVLHVRVDPDLLRKIRNAALKANKKPCEWMRRAVERAIAAEKKPK